MDAAPLTWARGCSTPHRVERVRRGRREAWVNAGDTDGAALGRERAAAALLRRAAVGFQPREEMFPGRAWERALARGQAGNYPVLLVDGVVQGVWHQRRSGRRIEVTVETWADLGPTPAAGRSTPRWRGSARSSRASRG